MAISKEAFQELLREYKNPEDLLREDGILTELTKALVESALGGELTDHLGYEKHGSGEKENRNRRNGSSKTTGRSDHGPIELEVPRDRDSSFEPKLMKENCISAVPKYRRRNGLYAEPEKAQSNILDRQFNHDEINTARVTDITYIRTWEGWLYLAAVTDLASR